jgi:hypothetical protein
MNKRRKRTKAEQRARRTKCEAANAHAVKAAAVLSAVLEMDDSELRGFEDFIGEIRASEERDDPHDNLEIAAALTA